MRIRISIYFIEIRFEKNYNVPVLSYTQKNKKGNGSVKSWV